MLAAARGLDELVRTEIGSLLVATPHRPQFGKDNPFRQRAAYSDLVLFEAGWQVERVEVDDPLCGAARVALELGIVVSTARRQMRTGIIPSVIVADARGGRSQRLARLSDLAARREQPARRALDLPSLAEQLGDSYHQTYQALRRLSPDCPRDPASGEYLIDDDTAQQLRADKARVEALHRRAMKVPEAAQRLRCAESTVYLHLRHGRLPVDEETDTSRAAPANVMMTAEENPHGNERPPRPVSRRLARPSLV